MGLGVKEYAIRAYVPGFGIQFGVLLRAANAHRHPRRDSFAGTTFILRIYCSIHSWSSLILSASSYCAKNPGSASTRLDREAFALAGVVVKEETV